MTADRRAFLRSAAALAAAAGLSLPDAAAAAEVQQPSARALDPALLRALGEAVLPASIGAAARTVAVQAFTAWIAAYRPVSEEMHGYGDAEIRYTPADPAPNWNAQLQALDLLARRTRRRAFAALPVAARREVVERQLSGVRGASLPSNPLTAPHVAVALLAHWASSTAAHDAAYSARILRGECRVLATAPRRPLPIAGGEG